MSAPLQGIVLAAGGGTRLRPLTTQLPKTLLAVTTDGRTILDLIVGNLAAVGVTTITVVTGHAAQAIEAARPGLQDRHGVDLDLQFNPQHDRLNNAYSLWLARHVLAGGALVVNGDTIHPSSVEERLLTARGTAPVLLAIDDDKPLAEEEMKVQLDAGRLLRIGKQIDPAAADGEYIGITLVEPEAADALADALQARFERTASSWYEDGYQELADRGGHVHAVPIGAGVPWVEVDDHDDLRRALAQSATGAGPG